MMRTRRRGGLVGVLLLALVALTPAPSAAADPNDEFGRHVVTCVHEHGFDAAHNPGMHHGRAGWDPSHVC